MSDQAMVDEIYRRLAAAPCGLDCKITEVLAACGMFVSAILVASYRDHAVRQDKINRFCVALQVCADRTPLAPRHSLH